MHVMGRCGGVFYLRMLHRDSVLPLLLCLVASLLPFSSAWPDKRSLIGSECSQGVWMVKNGQLGCLLCDKGQRWNRDKKHCENCRGRLTSCESNVFHGACSKTSCNDEGNPTSTGQPLPIPTQQPTTFSDHTATHRTYNNPATVGVAIIVPTSPKGPNPTTTISEKRADEPKEDEAILQPDIPPVKDDNESGNSGLAIKLGVGLGIVLLLLLIMVTIWFIVKKPLREPSSSRKSNAPEAQPCVWYVAQTQQTH